MKIMAKTRAMEKVIFGEGSRLLLSRDQWEAGYGQLISSNAIT